ncbi:major capsid protein [Mesorhizobium sp. WSM4906]|uniref:major capsid protein n=1 Tax=Mesorhizobium sp. WSM4906 TaxID=3038546 RepID=UPI002416F48D|nr:major capsid protein [Mesorhizobium sp. WSM4906]WFP74505.1 major capsid protein [Mesorhizobium sp. WSM4906]
MAGEMADIWDGDGFTVESLTAAINNEPYRPGQVSASGIFEEDGVTTTRISIEQRDGKLSLVEPTKRGAAGETVGDDDRSLVPFDIDHFQRDDSVLADEVQNVRQFGTTDQLETIERRVVRKGARHAQDLTMTLEHLRVGALKGIVTSKSGKTLIDLYNRFGIAVPAPVSLELDVETTKVGLLWQDVIYSIEDDLDEPYSGIHVFTGRDFHKALWTHKAVTDTFLYNAGASVLRQDVPDVFQFGSATWERYKTGAKATIDLGAPYIAANEARVVVKGVPELFITRFAPADYEETVNTIGLPLYMKQEPKRFNKGRDIQVQMNPINICTKPKVLRKLTLT